MPERTSHCPAPPLPMALAHHSSTSRGVSMVTSHHSFSTSHGVSMVNSGARGLGNLGKILLMDPKYTHIHGKEPVVELI